VSVAGQLSVPRPRRRLRRVGGEQGGGPIVYAVLILAAVVAVLPLYWTVVAASRSNADIAKTPPPFTPGDSLFSNIRAALDQVDMVKALFNSLIVSGSIALGTVLFCTLAGFAFAKLRFRGSNVLLVLVLATMMVPSQLGVVPLFMLMAKLEWVNQLQAVVFPTLVSAFGVVFMRSSARSSFPPRGRPWRCWG
jgi:cellobiose transport system permease protein